MEILKAKDGEGFYYEDGRLKASTDYGICSAAQPHAAAKNMMFAGVDNQQTCYEHVINMFRGKAALLWNEPKIVGFLGKPKDIPCRSVNRVCQYTFVQPSEERFVQYLYT